MLRRMAGTAGRQGSFVTLAHPFLRLCETFLCCGANGRADVRQLARQMRPSWQCNRIWQLPPGSKKVFNTETEREPRRATEAVCLPI